MNSTFLLAILSSLTTALPMSANDRNSARSPSISSLIPRISSNNAPASTPNPDSDSDFSFPFPFPFAATFLFFDGPASDLARLLIEVAVPTGGGLRRVPPETFLPRLHAPFAHLPILHEPRHPLFYENRPHQYL